MEGSHDVQNSCLDPLRKLLKAHGSWNFSPRLPQPSEDIAAAVRRHSWRDAAGLCYNGLNVRMNLASHPASAAETSSGLEGRRRFRSNWSVRVAPQRVSFAGHEDI
jgi:hypothetical protein